MSAKGWMMIAATIAVAAGTYFTLETIYPPQQTDPGGRRLADVEAVFSRTLQEPTEDSAEPAAESLSDDHASETLPEAAIPAPDDDASENAATENVDPEPADDSDAPAPTEAPAEQPTPSPTATPAPTATPEPEPAAAAAPTPASTPAATAAAASATAKPVPRATAAPAPKVTQWWGPESRSRLSIVYAGSAAYKRAIVLMLNGPFNDATTAQQHLKVTDASGKQVAGSWEIGANNRRMLLFPVSKAGTYTVTAGADLADQNGRRLESDLKGPVRVQ